MLPVLMIKYAVSIIASKTINVIDVILALTILILLIPIINSVLELSEIDVVKKLFMNSNDLTSNFLPPQFPNKLPFVLFKTPHPFRLHECSRPIQQKR